MGEQTKQGQAVMLTEGPGKGQRRVDYIRAEHKKGRSRGEIAKELGVAYQIVFAATKVKKEAAKTDEKAVDPKGKVTSIGGAPSGSKPASA